MSSEILSSAYSTGFAPGGSISGGISIGGLGNGTDFSATIDQLKKIELIPTQRMLRWKADWRERQDAFRTVRESLVALRDVCSKMSTMDKFLVKNATSSQASVAAATATSAAIQNSYKLEVNQVASTSIWSLGNAFYDNNTSINASGASQKFSYEYAGTVRNLTIPPNTTLEQLKNIINNDAGNPGVRVSLITGANGVTFQMKGMDQGVKNDLTILGTNGLTGFPAAADYAQHSLVYKTDFNALTDKVNDSGSDQTFTYSYNGTTKSVTIPTGTTVQGFVDLVNGAGNANLPANMNPVTAAVNAATGKVEIAFSGGLAGVPVEAPKGGGGSGLLAKFGIPTTESADPANWHIQHSQNAQIKVDGWPAGAGNWLEVSGNTVEGVVEGVTFNLVGTGESIVSVNVDAEAVQENVIGFIEAVNSFRKTVLDLTKYDVNKETLDVTYAESLYEMQKGSILTGNYGIQLLSSRVKQATAGSALGFLPRTIVDDVAFGDLYTSLSQIGIKTNASGEGGDLFGMLELNTDPKFPMIDDVLKKNPEAVADFFAAVNKGVSDSSSFSYSSSLQSITRPGVYDVAYTIDGNGDVIGGTINGKKAKWNAETNELGLARTDPTSSDASIVTAKTDGARDWTADIEVLATAHNSYVTMTTNMTSGTDPYVTTAGKFEYTVGGQTYSINAAAGDSIGMLCGKINYSLGNPGVTASWKNVNGAIEMTLTSKQNGAGGPAVTIPPPDPGNGTWSTTNGCGVIAGDTGSDAVITVNGTTETHKTNSIQSRTIPGATFDLKKAAPGTTVRVEAQAHNDADGLYVKIDDLTMNKSYSGTVRIKQGKIPELLELLNGTPNKPEEGILGTKGTIQVLLDNYDKIVEGIDKKINRETDRIAKWERTQKLRFARLDATLKQYDSLQKSIESQIKQLSGNK